MLALGLIFLLFLVSVMFCLSLFVFRFMADVYIILQVMPNTGAVFTSSSTSTSDTDTDTNPTSTNPKEPPPLGSSSPLQQPQATPTKEQQTDKENQADDLDDIHFDERLFVEAAPPEEDEIDDDELALPDSDSDAEEKEDVQASTPKSEKGQASPKDSSHHSIIETASTTPPARLSPILKAPAKLLPIETINECEMETDDLLPENDLKRKRDSFDSVSLMSVDSFALPASTKKPKLIRTGSITRTLKRSMSFVADRTPIIKTLRTRRSSIAAADASTFLGSEADDSMCSLASINTTLNESIRKPVKEKLRSICDRITRSSSKRAERCAEATPEHFGQLDSGFKTPKAPLQRASASASGKKTAKRLFGPVAGVGAGAGGAATSCSNTFSTNQTNGHGNANAATATATQAVPCSTSSSTSQESSTKQSPPPSSSSAPSTTAVDSKEPNDVVAAEEEPQMVLETQAENTLLGNTL